MFQLLSSLFTTTAERPAGVDNELIEAATDRVIEGTDTRLKALGSYRRQLRNPVEKAVVYVIDLIAELPEPVEISRRTFGSDPRLKAFFASFDHMLEKVGAAKTVEAYLQQTAIGDNSRLYGLLSMQWKEQNRLGMVLQDDRIQRDVQQTAVNFINHNFVGPSVSSEEAAINMKKRAFDFMIGIALERIIANRTRFADLEQQQLLLKTKLKAMKAGNWGLEEVLRPETSGAKDLSPLEAEIEAVERELAKMGARHEVLDKNLQIIKDTLDKPDELLALHSIAFELDSMNIKGDTSTSAKVHRLELIEAYSGIGAARILLPGWFPVSELPAARASIADAMRYL
jgi:hypothetical protein